MIQHRLECLRVPVLSTTCFICSVCVVNLLAASRAFAAPEGPGAAGRAFAQATSPQNSPSSNPPPANPPQNSSQQAQPQQKPPQQQQNPFENVPQAPEKPTPPPNTQQPQPAKMGE